MVKTIEKKDFGTKVLKSMIPGDAVLVLCSDHKEMNSARCIVYQHNRLRKEQFKSQGVLMFNVERREGNNIAVTAEPGYKTAQ